MPERTPNHLIKEKSPYLLQHAYNPVQWYPWGEEALKKAKNDGKPIFLSIGYSTCHWCHRMAEESYEDASIASVINKNFIPIKVDREERPEIDAYYMNAVQAMTGSGGWPLNAFLTPDLKPFYGGTYFPPEPRYGMPSFKQVLEFVAQVWKDKRSEIVANSERVASSISGGLQRRETGDLKPSVLDEGYANIISNFDSLHGGFGGAPKFPIPLTPSYLIRYWFRTGKEMALTSVTKTLDEIMSGGIRDHVGGGFHRYSTDRVWLVPHFEKMLYDNALLAKLYTEAYQATKKKEFASVAEETLNWILTEMTGRGGGFYSAQDADTSEGEGVYYTWTPTELETALGKTDGASFAELYGVTKNGNFEGRSILNMSQSHRADAYAQKAAKWKEVLYKARVKRPRPATDDKILTSWNGLAISAMSFAGTVLQAPKFVSAAVKAADFILRTNARDGKLLRRYAGGEAGLGGTLEDYAFFVQGLLDLFEVTGKPRWLQEATKLARIMTTDFEDGKEGGFYLSLEATPVRLKESYDGPTPSGNSVAAVDLIRLAELTGLEEFRRAAERTLKFFSSDIEDQPAGHANFLIALDLLLNGVTEVVITARDKPGTEEMRGVVFEDFIPNKVVLSVDSADFDEMSKLTTLLEDRKPRPRPRAYVCQNFACKLPADSVEALRSQLAPKQTLSAKNPAVK